MRKKKYIYIYIKWHKERKTQISVTDRLKQIGGLHGKEFTNLLRNGKNHDIEGQSANNLAFSPFSVLFTN